MRWALNGSVAMNGREREGWEGVECLQEGSKGLSYTDEWALAGNHRVASLSNESEDATRKESTCKLIFTKRKGYTSTSKAEFGLDRKLRSCWRLHQSCSSLWRSSTRQWRLVRSMRSHDRQQSHSNEVTTSDRAIYRYVHLYGWSVATPPAIPPPLSGQFSVVYVSVFFCVFYFFW